MFAIKAFYGDFQAYVILRDSEIEVSESILTELAKALRFSHEKVMSASSLARYFLDDFANPEVDSDELATVLTFVDFVIFALGN